MFKKLFLPLIAVAAFIVLVGLLIQGKFGNILSGSSSQTGIVTQVKEDKLVQIGEVSIKVEIANSSEERQKGLSGRASLDVNNGVLFVMPENSKPNFWMKDTLFPLDIIWIKDSKVIGIEKDVQTEINKSDAEMTLYPAPGVVDYVLEVNAGFSEKNNIDIDSTVTVPDNL